MLIILNLTLLMLLLLLLNIDGVMGIFSNLGHFLCPLKATVNFECVIEVQDNFYTTDSIDHVTGSHFVTLRKTWASNSRNGILFIFLAPNQKSSPSGFDVTFGKALAQSTNRNVCFVSSITKKNYRLFLQHVHEESTFCIEQVGNIAAHAAMEIIKEHKLNSIHAVGLGFGANIAGYFAECMANRHHRKPEKYIHQQDIIEQLTLVNPRDDVPLPGFIKYINEHFATYVHIICPNRDLTEHTGHANIRVHNEEERTVSTEFLITLFKETALKKVTLIATKIRTNHGSKNEQVGHVSTDPNAEIKPAFEVLVGIHSKKPHENEISNDWEKVKASRFYGIMVTIGQLQPFTLHRAKPLHK